MLDDYSILDDFDDSDESVTPDQLGNLLGIDTADVLAALEEAAQ